VVFAGALLLLATGCADRRAVLYQGVHLGMRNTPTRFSDGDAQRIGRQAEASWRRELQGRARSDPDERFANLALTPGPAVACSCRTSTTRMPSSLQPS
jgi:hypothetical protein